MRWWFTDSKDEHSVTLWSIHNSPSPCRSYIHTCNFTFEGKMHVVYIKCTHTVGMAANDVISAHHLHIHRPTSPKQNKKNSPGASVICQWSTKRDCCSLNCGQTNVVIYSAHSFLTRSTNLFLSWTTSNHSGYTRQHCVVLFVCHSVFIMFPVFTILLLNFRQSAGFWIMRTKLKHDRPHCLS